MAENPQSEVVTRPRGTFVGKVDDKGRLKLPVDFQRYLEQQGAKKFFVTSLDKQTARIYPIPVWEQVEDLLNQPGPDADMGSDILLRANFYGHETEIDSSGRLVLPAKTRRLLGLENVDVHLLYIKGHVRVYSEAKIEELVENGSARSEEDVKHFERKGLQ